ncbi:MAG: ABC-2 transporter permease [Acidobacteriales bacterium]|nr:ABC-2 transporter permease [Terriglobales bacterium]
MRPLLFLVLKDFQLHWRSLLVSWAILLAASLFFTRNATSEFVALATILVYSMMATIAYSDWLIYREKAKGTVAWLRALPLSDLQIVSSKFIAHGLMLAGGFILCVALLQPGLFRPSRAPLLLLSFFGLQAFGTFMVASRWLFGLKLGQAAPFFAPLVLYLMVYRLMKDDPQSVQGWLFSLRDPRNAAAGCVLLAAIGVASWYLVLRWFSGRDTQQLID